MLKALLPSSSVLRLGVPVSCIPARALPTRPFHQSCWLRVNMQDRIRSKLTEALSPSTLEIENDSAQHAGHAAMRAPGANTGETHFTVQIVSDKFEGLKAIQRHRLVNGALDEEFKTGLHALIIKAKAPSEVNK